MNIGIVTIVDYTNYGNRLQNYAAYRFFHDQMNLTVKTLTADHNKQFDNHHYVHWLKNRIVRLISVFPAVSEKRFSAQVIRNANFRRWSEKIPMEVYHEHSALPSSVNDKYDLFFVGSDQVWNCNFPAFRKNDYFLTFADNEKKCSLSASFGFDSIPENKKNEFKEELKRFSHISVREKAGQEIIRDLIGKDVPVLIDPVMMLDESEWMKVAKKPRVDTSHKYVLKYYLGDQDQEDSIEKWASLNGYKVYELLDQNNKQLYSAGPGEFLSLIKNASLICSDSFHCIVFAILFKKPFVVYSRIGKENYMTSRLNTLLEKFGFENRWSSKLNEEDYLICDFAGTDEKLAEERKKFKTYIEAVIGFKDKSVIQPKLADRQSCTGCTACASVCPAECIHMLKDRYGFVYPEIPDISRCLHCGQCERVCPVINKIESSDTPKAYAAISRDSKNREESSSGGIFSEIAKEIIAENGIVFGAVYNETFEVVHCSAETNEELQKMRGAKYAQSDLKSTFQSIKTELESGRKVLFSGTPCQAAGLKAYLKNDFDNLICMDFVCHGIPSPLAWREYIRFRSEKDNLGKMPVSINLRSKTTGWSRYKYSNEFTYNSSKYSVLSSDSEYMKLFVGDYINRKSCTDCLFKGYGRCSDFTIGDFWGIWDIAPEMDDNKGTSVVLLHTDKAERLFNTISSRLTIKEVSLSDASRQNPSMIKSSDSAAARDQTLEAVRTGTYFK